MRSLFVVFICIAYAGTTLCQAQAATDFRGYAWSNTLNQVKNAEKSEFIKQISDDELVYKDKLGGSDCTVVYIFNDNDKLVSGVYFFEKKYSNPQLYLQDYNKFKSLLTIKYGKPVSEKENWTGAATADQIQNYGQAIADGKLQVSTVWNTDRSVIKIALVSIDKQPDLEIHYTARSLDELENKEEMKAAINKL